MSLQCRKIITSGSSQGEPGRTATRIPLDRATPATYSTRASRPILLGPVRVPRERSERKAAARSGRDDGSQSAPP